MNLPPHIEAYLTEVDFSNTEILILRNAIGGKMYTLRELASKTGKSTGVLDQALKKLITKKIIQKETVNGTSKYSLKSLDALQQNLHKTIEEQCTLLRRRNEDFSSFVQSVKQTDQRPKLQFFEGKEGLKQAYTLLLNSTEEILQFWPSTTENDPLSEYRKECIRTRRARGIHCRTIAPNAMSGKKLQERDHLEYRKTQLLPSEFFTHSFEKLLNHHLIGCFDFEKNIACVIDFPEYCRIERAMFEQLWTLIAATSVDGEQKQVQKDFQHIQHSTYSKLPNWTIHVAKVLNILPRSRIQNAKSILTKLQICACDYPGIIHKITKPFAVRNINISQFDHYAFFQNSDLYDIAFETHSKDEASYLIDDLKQIPGVVSIRNQ